MIKEIKSVFDKINRYKCCSVFEQQGDYTKMKCPFYSEKEAGGKIKKSIKQIIKSVETNRLCSIHIREDEKQSVSDK